MKLDEEFHFTPVFLESTAKLYAFTFHISIPTESIIKDIVKTKIESHVCLTQASVIEFYSDKVTNDMMIVFMDNIRKSKNFTQRKFKNIKLNSKDHQKVVLNFIYSCSGLRALNFKLSPIKKYKVEHMAFKVTPT